MNVVRPCGLLLVLLSLVAAFPAAVDLSAQQTQAEREIERRTGRQVGPDEIMRGLAQSGLSRAEVRSRLRQRGLDPSMADPYFDRLENQGRGELQAPGDDFVRALAEMGLLDPGMDPAGMPGSGISEGSAPAPRPDSIAPGDTFPVFGKAIFARQTGQFQPILTGPVPPSYRLGPGDELSLVVTGDVELAYTLPVSREGFVVIPDVGQVSVNGLTLGQLEDRLYDRLGRVYSGVRRGPDATTQFQVSLGRLRVIQVFVIGEVESPGLYELPSTGTVLSALYRAGGPGFNGSFRSVEVRRGGAVVGVVDLYRYLLTGDTGVDIRLEQGDVLFVPLAGNQVRVTGAVQREAIYELLPHEGLEHAVTYAGGPGPNADVRRVRVDRILPYAEQRPGLERVLEVVNLLAATAEGDRIRLSDGDRVRVPAIGVEQKNRVTLGGFVYGTGEFELLPGMTVWDLLERAGGLRPEAFQPVAHVRRLDPSDSTHVLFRVSLERGPEGNPVDDLVLADQDSVTVFGRPTLLNADSVEIAGEVKSPGRYGFARGMTAEDLILSADGFTKEAQGLELEVARLRISAERNDTISERFRVRLGGTLPWQTGDRLGTIRDGTLADLPEAGEFVLEEGDQVFVRELPGYVEPRAVQLRGEVLFPGPYAFNVREERVSSFVRRAGGLTDDAYIGGARLERDSIPLGLDLREALANPGTSADPIMMPNDRLTVPLYDGTVAIQGAVAWESRVIYREGADLDYYLAQAGGTLEEADEDRINIEYRNGARATTSKTLWMRSYPEVRPGSVIHVPLEVEGSGTDWSNIITTSLSILSTTATLILAIARL